MELYRVNKARLKAVAKKYKLDLIVLFGSQANGRAVAGRSDLDVAVRFAHRARRDTSAYGLHAALRPALQPDGELHITVLNGASPLLLFEVAAEGVPLYERTPTAFLRFWSYSMRRYDDNRKYFALCRQYLREHYA